MAPSQVSGMKMRNLLFGVILGLLAVVHSIPVDTVTQIPTKSDDEVYREAVTDGFLVEHFSHPSLTTESPKGNTTIQASQQPPSDSTEGDIFEGSTGETSDMYTTSVSTTSTFMSTTSVSLQFSETTPSSTSTVSTQTSDSGSGDGEMFGQHSTTAYTMISSSNTETSTASSISTTETSTASSTSLADFIGSVKEGSSEGSGEESGSGTEITLLRETTEVLNLRKINIPPISNEGKVKVPEAEADASPQEPQNKGHHTPGWIIILGFLVGVAALVMLFVAIATRDKWNGPSKAFQQETKTNASNQQRGVEMETFLHKENPKENGKAAEYTVIPLDELPEKYSSH